MLGEEGPQECNCPQILIVDDEPFNIIALEGLLHQIGIKKIDQAFNGQDGLKQLEENFKMDRSMCHRHKPYALVVTDNQMPLLSGL